MLQEFVGFNLLKLEPLYPGSNSSKNLIKITNCNKRFVTRDHDLKIKSNQRPNSNQQYTFNSVNKESYKDTGQV